MARRTVCCSSTTAVLRITQSLTPVRSLARPPAHTTVASSHPATDLCNTSGIRPSHVPCLFSRRSAPLAKSLPFFASSRSAERLWGAQLNFVKVSGFNCVEVFGTEPLFRQPVGLTNHGARTSSRQGVSVVRVNNESNHFFNHTLTSFRSWR